MWVRTGHGYASRSPLERSRWDRRARPRCTRPRHRRRRTDPARNLDRPANACRIADQRRMSRRVAQCDRPGRCLDRPSGRRIRTVTLRAAAIVGATGAVTTNVLHEIIRRVAANAPHVDLLGMQALARAVDAAGATPPRRHAATRTVALRADACRRSAFERRVLCAHRPGLAARRRTRSSRAPCSVSLGASAQSCSHGRSGSRPIPRRARCARPC